MVSTVDDKWNKTLTGGMMKRQRPGQQGITAYIDLKSVQEYSAKVEQLGHGHIHNNASARYGAICADTENNAVAIWETGNTAR